MAKWINWTREQEQQWIDWLASRPEVIRALVEEHQLRPDELYRLKTTGQQIRIAALDENGTVRVMVEPQFNPHIPLFTAPISVFGIDPKDLEPCECPIPVVDGAEAQIYNDTLQQIVFYFIDLNGDWHTYNCALPPELQSDARLGALNAYREKHGVPENFKVEEGEVIGEYFIYIHQRLMEVEGSNLSEMSKYRLCRAYIFNGPGAGASMQDVETFVPVELRREFEGDVEE